jgi:hypothetical protein
MAIVRTSLGGIDSNGAPMAGSAGSSPKARKLGTDFPDGPLIAR